MQLLKSYRFIMTLVSFIGIALSILIAYFVHQHQLAQIKSDFEREVINRNLALQRSLDSALLIGDSVVGYYSSSVEVTRKEFNTFVKVFQGKTPFMRAIEWVPRVTQAERPLFEAYARESFPDFSITEYDDNAQVIPSKLRQEYYPVYFIEPYAGNEKALGFDLASNKDRRMALELARDRNTLSTTNRIRLVQDGITGSGDWGVLVIYPVYKNNQPHNTVTQRRKNLQGFVVIVLDMNEFVESSLKYLKPAGVNMIIHDDTAQPDNRFLYFHRSRSLKNNEPHPINTQKQRHSTGLQHTNMIIVNNRKWSVTYESAPGYFDTSISLSVIAAGLIGLIITLLIVYILNLLHTRASFLQIDKDLLEKLVAKRTQELEYRNRDLESYSYSIAHDLRTPLRSITSFSQILMEGAYDKLDQEHRGYLDRVIRAGKKMAQLIDDILKITRISRHKFEISPVNLSIMALEQVNYLRTLEEEERRNPIDWHVQDSLFTDCDPALITTVLDNLLENAYKFTAQTPKPVIEFGMLDDAVEKVYFVRDNGVGLNMQYADKIFEMFERLHDENEFKGTGIGLATVKRIIELHGGRIWVESFPGKSTTFYFTIASG